MNTKTQDQVDEALDTSIEHLSKVLTNGAASYDMGLYIAFGQLLNAQYSKKIAEYLKYIHLNNS